MTGTRGLLGLGRDARHPRGYGRLAETSKRGVGGVDREVQGARERERERERRGEETRDKKETERRTEVHTRAD